jgi:hypothetical protein
MHSYSVDTGKCMRRLAPRLKGELVKWWGTQQFVLVFVSPQLRYACTDLSVLEVKIKLNLWCLV